MEVTPNNSFYVRMMLLNDSWNYVEIGDNSTWENSLALPALISYNYVKNMKAINAVSEVYNSFLGKDKKTKCGVE